MKKVKYVLVVMIMFMVPLFVMAKTNIEGTDIVDIKIPENFRLCTKENIDETMTWLGFDSTGKTNYKYAWTTNSYYFDIIKEDKSTEIILIKKMSDSSLDDLSIYQDEKINETFKDVNEEYKNYDPEISLFKSNEGVKYYKIEYKDENQNLNIIDYITNIHGNMYQYKVQSTIEITNELKKDVEDIIKSVEYEGYVDFIKNNTITDEPKKSNAPIIIVIILILIIGIGIVVYIFMGKRKNNNKNNNEVTSYTPVQSNFSNPVVADFMNPSSQPNTLQQQNNNNGENNNNNNK